MIDKVVSFLPYWCTWSMHARIDPLLRLRARMQWREYFHDLQKRLKQLVKVDRIAAEWLKAKCSPSPPLNAYTRLPLLTGCKIPPTFPRLSRTFSSKFKDFLYQMKHSILKALLSCVSIQQWALQDLLLWKNRASVYVFKYCYIERTMFSRLWQTAHFDYFFEVKGEKILPIPGFLRTATQVQGFSREFSFANSRDFPGFLRIVSTLHADEGSLAPDLLRTKKLFGLWFSIGIQVRQGDV